MAKDTAPAFDITAVAVEDSDTVPTIRRARKFKDNPFTTHLLASFQTGKAKVVVVPETSVKEVLYLIRSAANDNGIGVRIAQEEVGEGRVRVTFLGRERRAYTKH